MKLLAFAAIFVLVDVVALRFGIDCFTAPSHFWRAVPLAAILAVSVAYAMSERPAAVSRMFGRAESFLVPSGAPSALVLAVAVAGLCALLAQGVMDGFPFSGDENAYVFQAETFRQGRLWLMAPPIEPYLADFSIFDIGGRLVSQYPPAWPAVLALASRIGIPPWLVDPLVTGGLVLAVCGLGRAVSDWTTGILAALITGACSFTLFNGASFFNHVFTALSGVIFVILVMKFYGRKKIIVPLGVGFTFSIFAATRHYDAVLLAAPAGIFLLRKASRADLPRFGWAMLGALPVCALVLGYYALVTGSPLQTTQGLVDPNDGLLGPGYSATRSAGISVGRIVELAEWTSPALVVAYAMALHRRWRTGRLAFFDAYGLVFMAGYALFWANGGHRWGPRYLYPALPFMALTTSLAMMELARGARASAAMRLMPGLGIAAIVAAMVQIPFMAIHVGRIFTEAQDVYRQVARMKPKNSVVLLLSGTGVLWTEPFGNLARNGTSPLRRNVIYAHTGNLFGIEASPASVGPALAALEAHLPGRRIWIYERAPRDPVGKLEPLDRPVRQALFSAARGSGLHHAPDHGQHDAQGDEP